MVQEYAGCAKVMVALVLYVHLENVQNVMAVAICKLPIINVSSEKGPLA